MESTISRRKLIFWGLGAVLAAASSSFWGRLKGGRLLWGMFSDRISQFDAGPIERYAIGKVDRRWKAKHGVWLVRTLDGVYALPAKNQAGETVEWDEPRGDFFSLESGDRYYRSGVHFQGKNKESLQRMPVRELADGRLSAPSLRWNVGR